MLSGPLPDPAPILLLGDPRLRQRAEPVGDRDDAELEAGARRLAATLEAFRRRHGFGRAIAAPQIGLPWRLVALDLGEGPRLLFDPEITWRSDATFTLWDDCMSFPGLLVRVRRHDSVTVRFRDEEGAVRIWERLDRARAELLQHEIDHLDGILAVDRALDRDSLVLREVFDADPARFASQVDYVIPSYRSPPG